MATTTGSMGPNEFEDSDFQHIFDILKNADKQSDPRMRAAQLRVIAIQLEKLAIKLDPSSRNREDTLS